ncbi:MAG: septum formation inhibitor Maf [Acidobacteria bacterium]|nr:septum formation inhibitor Maf [Acidobacteriota bacterium]
MGDVTALILASGSPRRHHLLQIIGMPHLVIQANIEEIRRPGESPIDFTRRVACDKALSVAASHPGQPVLGADTVVEVGGDVLGKPHSQEEAADMLHRLSGRAHTVHTAMALAHGERCESLVSSAAVEFEELTPAQIAWYIATGEPMDKAGAYAIQGYGSLFVKRVAGSPHTVIGLPVHQLPRLFERFGLSLWDQITGATHIQS